ncbi:MAG: 2-oxoglutarate dehydrogenase E1 component [Deltaproteobacteria bacterium]|jgi:2-oxoglutarate dehydrogenase E1 component|nr:2-oxoglutarate dehydrogenase E1 component [Deltaproteobacteria bacterium]
MDVSLTWNADFIDSQYKLWKSDPKRVSREWRIFFEGFELAAFPEREAVGICHKSEVLRQARVNELIHRYRDLGHLLACLDPLVSCPTDHPLLNLTAFNLSGEDLERSFYAENFSDSGQAPLREILQALKETYCRSIGVEYMHLQDPDERSWLQERMEPGRNRPHLEAQDKIRILNKLCQATLFEEFLHTKYVGQKRFSLEGAEVVVAMLDGLIQHASERGCREMIMGMAHRGRLNVQVNNLLKLYETIFCEFDDNYDPESLVGSGDVKYHKGFMADIQTLHGKALRILLASNPSHLEAVNPVVEGIARARQDQAGDLDGKKILPLLIHGDSAFAGQGIVAETLNLSQLEGYRTGGTVHIVINNQIGFTTLPEDARSTRYATDVAKMLMVPIFHVHGENPEAALHVVKLACDYRMEFAKDVVIDVVCYRRYGHNEGDEPYYTQPRMYDRIRERPPVYEIYAEKLQDEKVVVKEDLEQIKSGINECLARAYDSERDKTCGPPESPFYESWSEIRGNYSHTPVETGVKREELVSIARKMHHVPKGFSVHRKLERILDRRLEVVEKGEGIDWATAELLAFGSLLLEGTPVRLSGQDSRRGTFSQRHSVLTDMHLGEHYTPLNHLSEDQALYTVYDSMLSENAVLGFEYGYSLASPRSLVIWEAQFGDFANNAQVIIDQFISSAQYKWNRLSGLVLFLPHGFEGQGPEHSSARLERYLQLCVEDNIQVCYPTTPAQHFHMLRRQVKRDFRKPLIVMTPKSLLRHPLAVSSLEEMASGHFQEVLDDALEIQNPKRVIFCSGKVYYDLLERRRDLQISNIAILRIEQFYPFPEKPLEKIISRYGSAEEWCWVQEEPENMGGWSFMRHRLQDRVGKALQYIGRAAAASPATGHLVTHKLELTALLDLAIGIKAQG